MKTSKKLDAYKAAVADYDFAMETVRRMEQRMRDIDNISIGSSITVNSRSSDKQFIYAVGILHNQMNACHELSMPDLEYREMKDRVLELSDLKREYEPWCDYASALKKYMREVRGLLSNDELFELLEKPVKE